MTDSGDLVVAGKQVKKPPKQRPPAGLGKAGRALWGQLTERFVFEPHEVVVLTLACKRMDAIAELEDLIATEGLTVAGSTGQRRLSPAVAELRLTSLAVAKLLGSLALPDDATAKPLTAASLRARKAAISRWDRQRDLRARREASS